MTDWIKTTGDAKPEELDTTSSPTTVYERQNIRQETVADAKDGEAVARWVYDERTLTPEEYAKQKETETTMQALSDMEANLTLAFLDLLPATEEVAAATPETTAISDSGDGSAASGEAATATETESTSAGADEPAVESAPEATTEETADARVEAANAETAETTTEKVVEETTETEDAQNEQNV